MGIEIARMGRMPASGLVQVGSVQARIPRCSRSLFSNGPEYRLQRVPTSHGNHASYARLSASRLRFAPRDPDTVGVVSPAFSVPPIRSVSVLIPTFQGAPLLELLLERLAQQDPGIDWDVLCIDSGSSDGSLEILERAARDFPVPMTVRTIDQVEFNHGDTRNQLAAWSTGDLLVFLTQDAVPSSADWLATLVKNFEDERVGAVSCRNVVREGADFLTALFALEDPGYAPERRVVSLPEPEIYAALDPDQRRLLYGLNDVASGVRRALWERHPFPRTDFGEDVLMARAVLEMGFLLIYDCDACVEHSHDYDAAQAHARAIADGRFNAEWLGRVTVSDQQSARELAKRYSDSDAVAIRAQVSNGALAQELERRAAELRLAVFSGLAKGAQTDLRRPWSQPLEETSLHILFCVHGFPPDTWAGTEIYTLHLAKELMALGHRCTVFTRVPGMRDGEPDQTRDFEVVESEFEGLRVLRMTHRLEHGSLGETYRQPRAEEALRQALQRERPDLVHFQHLIHGSIGMVEAAKSMDLPTVIHCHDFWALCARVQMIRPDAALCDENMGLGCLLCVKDRDLKHVPKAAQWGKRLQPLTDALGRAASRGWLGSKRRRIGSEYLDLRARESEVPAAFAACDLVISPSRFLRNQLLKSGAFDPGRFLYCDNGMRTDHVAALEKPRDPKGRVRFGFIGTLVWYKGGETLIRAMARLVDFPAVLHIFGGFDPQTDEHHKHLHKLAQASSVDIQFHGRFDNSKLSEVYAQIDVLIVPSIWYENSPITIHEAYLTRTPVIASNIGGMAEYVRDGVDGLHFQVGDDADLARVMERFLDEPNLVEELSRDFMQIKSIADNARETEARYRALLCAQRGRSQSVLFEYAGSATTRRKGEAEVQGGEWILIRPPGGSVEYDLSAVDPGSYELQVEVLALAGETQVTLGGRVLLGKQLLAALPRFQGGAQEDLQNFSMPLELGSGERRLRFDNGGAEKSAALHLRIKKIQLRPTRPAADVAPPKPVGVGQEFPV